MLRSASWCAAGEHPCPNVPGSAFLSGIFAVIRLSRRVRDAFVLWKAGFSSYRGDCGGKLAAASLRFEVNTGWFRRFSGVTGSFVADASSLLAALLPERLLLAHRFLVPLEILPVAAAAAPLPSRYRRR
jgi:hypothetical protein